MNKVFVVRKLKVDECFFNLPENRSTYAKQTLKLTCNVRKLRVGFRLFYV